MLFHTDIAFAVLIALVLDAAVGDPDSIWRRWPHPVTWIGATIGGLDRRLNDDRLSFHMRKQRGIFALLLLLLLWGALAFLLETLLRMLPFAGLWIGIAGSIFIAQKSLYDHVARVRDALMNGDIAGARKAIAMIVGRNPDNLNEPGIARAAIETTAENFSDGVVAPVFWFLLAGLPGLVLYKMINTADSMIGHRSERHEAFGWAAARLDDLVNLAPARLAGLLIAASAPVIGASPREAFRIMLRDARLHRSPNAGWPEAAMAGALGIALAGPRRYATHVVEDPFLHPAGRFDIGATEICQALRLLVTASALEMIAIAGLALAFS